MVILLSAIASPTFAATITKVQDLSFGKLFAGSGGGTVTITPNAGGASRSTTGTVTTFDNTFQQAQFSVTFAPLELNILTDEVTFTVAPDPATLTRGGGGTMTLTNYTSSPFPFNTGVIGLLQGVLSFVLGGTVQLYVGGTLTIDANETPGIYTDTITVTVTVN